MIMCVTTINVRQLFIVPEFLFRFWSKLYKTASLKCYQILGSSQYMWIINIILYKFLWICKFHSIIWTKENILLILWNSTTMKFNKIGVQRKMV